MITLTISEICMTAGSIIELIALIAMGLCMLGVILLIIHLLIMLVLLIISNFHE
jgi:hypothetical protein